MDSRLPNSHVQVTIVKNCRENSWFWGFFHTILSYKCPLWNVNLVANYFLKQEIWRNIFTEFMKPSKRIPFRISKCHQISSTLLNNYIHILQESFEGLSRIINSVKLIFQNIMGVEYFQFIYTPTYYTSWIKWH